MVHRYVDAILRNGFVSLTKLRTPMRLASSGYGVGEPWNVTLGYPPKV